MIWVKPIIPYAVPSHLIANTMIWDAIWHFERPAAPNP
jgi:hypothetical protein